MDREKLQFNKYFTQYLCNNLRKIPGTLLKNSYIRSYNCSSTLQLSGETLISTRCKNRFCLYCNRIRTAELITLYLDSISKLDNPFFLTLTIPNCSGKDLSYMIDLMSKNFLNCKKYLERKGFRLFGMRKIEVTYNPTNNTYHPHFHLIVDGGFCCEILVKKWLNLFPEANRSAQHYLVADISS